MYKCNVNQSPPSFSGVMEGRPHMFKNASFKTKFGRSGVKGFWLDHIKVAYLKLRSARVAPVMIFSVTFYLELCNVITYLPRMPVFTK